MILLSFAYLVLGLLVPTTPISAQSLARLEQADSAGIYFGAWYNRFYDDSPWEINQRLNYRSLSIWQVDVNINETLETVEIDRFLGHVMQTKSDAFVYVTVYPHDGFDKVSDKAIQDLIVRVKRVVDNGGRMFVRYGSEMNGGWFPYGQKPESFIQSWRRVVDAVRKGVRNPQNVAFVWAPNSPNGYPFSSERYAANSSSPEIKALDTNGNGRLDDRDDPFTPYYPGDEWVDWIGVSVYHFGREYPWSQNVLPRPGHIESVLTGRNGYSLFNLYRMFSGDGVGGQPSSQSKGGKPFMITETGSTVHLGFANGTRINNTDDPVSIKRNWWRQYLNTTFLRSYPKVKAVCTFEFVKFEETTWRDFTNFGVSNKLLRQLNVSSTNVETNGADTLKAFREDLQGDYGKVIIWANASNVQYNNAASKDGLNTLTTMAWATMSSFILISIFL